MTFEDLKNVVQEVHTGANNPGRIALITKLVLNKIVRRRLPERVKTGTITTGGNKEFVLTTELADFLALKTDGENNNRCVYYYPSGDSGNQAFFFDLVAPSRFTQNIGGGYATVIGRTLKISLGDGVKVPDTIYLPYYSNYLVLDEDGTTEKESPENNDDTFLLNTAFDDVLVDGVLLYLTRREKDNGEFAKASREWDRQLTEVIFYQ